MKSRIKSDLVTLLKAQIIVFGGFYLIITLASAVTGGVRMAYEGSLDRLEAILAAFVPIFLLWYLLFGVRNYRETKDKKILNSFKNVKSKDLGSR